MAAPPLPAPPRPPRGDRVAPVGSPRGLRGAPPCPSRPPPPPTRPRRGARGSPLAPAGGGTGISHAGPALAPRSDGHGGCPGTGGWGPVSGWPKPCHTIAATGVWGGGMSLQPPPASSVAPVPPARREPGPGQLLPGLEMFWRCSGFLPGALFPSLHRCPSTPPELEVPSDEFSTSPPAELCPLSSALTPPSSLLRAEVTPQRVRMAFAVDSLSPPATTLKTALQQGERRWAPLTRVLLLLCTYEFVVV